MFSSSDYFYLVLSELLQSNLESAVRSAIAKAYNENAVSDLGDYP